MRRLFQCAAVAALLVGVAPFAAEAQTMALPHGLYVGVDAGVVVPESISLKGSETSGGTPSPSTAISISRPARPPASRLAITSIRSSPSKAISNMPASISIR